MIWSVISTCSSWYKLASQCQEISYKCHRSPHYPRAPPHQCAREENVLIEHCCMVPQQQLKPRSKNNNSPLQTEKQIHYYDLYNNQQQYSHQHDLNITITVLKILNVIPEGKGRWWIQVWISFHNQQKDVPKGVNPNQNQYHHQQRWKPKTLEDRYSYQPIS